MSSLQKKEKNWFSIDFLSDEIDADTTFVNNFLDVFIVQKRVIHLSKGLFRGTYSIKELTFQPSFEYRRFKLMADLHLTRKEILFLENLTLIKKLYDNESATIFIPYPISKFVKIPQQSSLFLQFLKICRVQNPVWSGLESDFQSFDLKNFKPSSQVYIKIKKLNVYPIINSFSLVI